MLAQQYDARIGNEQHQQADEPDPDALPEGCLVELRLVYFGQQIPVGAHDGVYGAKDLDTAVILAKEHLLVTFTGAAIEKLGCQQSAVADGDLQGEGRGGAVAHVIEKLHLITLLAKQQGFTTAVRDRPLLENIVEPIA